jgi:molybdopterin-containing oxidoreductase family iron-sulfur binding subunit
MNKLDRRKMLKLLGWSSASLAAGACGNPPQSGNTTAEAYSEPDGYNVPGLGVYFASVCTLCEAGCGIKGRVREGRVLKLEGNGECAISKGRLCGLGQAAVQHHYNPDRLKEPLLRQNGRLEPVSWDKALGLIEEKTGAGGETFAFLTGPVSGHLKVLVQAYAEALGSKNHFVYDLLANKANRVAAEQVYGVPNPVYEIAKAKLILSFGADFLNCWESPVHFSAQYAGFRKANDAKPRGVLIQAEPKMTLTGANADRWIAIKPSSEGIFALGLVNVLLEDPRFAKNVPAAIAGAVRKYDKARALRETGVSEEVFVRVAALLRELSPSLVLSGPMAEGQINGAQNAAAIMLLNAVLGNVGKTVTAPAQVPFPQMAPASGDSSALIAFNQALARGTLKTVFFHGANPVFTAPGFMKLRENLRKAAFKVSFGHYLDETAGEADLVLPLDSALEDWGTHAPAYQAGGGVQIGMQQPLMERLYPEGTRSMGDVLLTLLKRRRPSEYAQFPDYYAYLKAAVIANKAAFKDAPQDGEEFWYQALSRGVLNAAAPARAAMAPNLSSLDLELAKPAEEDAHYPLRLVPSVRAGLRDGAHANLPWVQETPDPLTTIVWDSWLEIHPRTAERWGIAEGDIVEVISKSGTIKAQAYLFPGLEANTVAIPIGNGHEAMGRYAKDTGVNPLKILDPVFEKATGELALYATRVLLRKTDATRAVVKDEGWRPGVVNMQMNRKIVATIAADKVKLFPEE